MNDRFNGRPASCNAACRKETACQLKYAVNEFSMLCAGYDFSIADSWYYFMGALSNPWVDLETIE